MTQPVIPPEVRRFILTSVLSVPYLEALLLLRNEPATAWTSALVAQRLYLSETMAEGLLQQLTRAGIIVNERDHPREYRYQPHSSELNERIDQLAGVYAKHLVEVTHLIHSKTDRQAQQFADAFKWRKDP